MRILYLFRSLAVWGGIERILVDKMNGLASAYGADVYMLTTDQGDHAMPYRLGAHVSVEDLGICFHHRYRYHGLRRLWVYGRMRHTYRRLLSARLRTIRPDVIVCTTADDIGLIASLKGSTPLVVESHSICSRTVSRGRPWPLGFLRSRLFLRALRRADVLVALTEGDAAEWRRYHPDVRVIPNMIRRNEASLSSLSSRRVIFVGRFDYQKRVQEAIRIWETVSADYPDWTLDIYGEGEMAADIERLASTVPNIVLHRPTDNIYDCYRDSSVLILTSLFEPFGLVLPEAMNCGLPVVAYSCPYGPAAIIRDGVDGFLIDDRDEGLFAQKLRLLMGDASLRRRMGRAASVSSSRYYPDNILPQWKRLFDFFINKLGSME